MTRSTAGLPDLLIDACSGNEAAWWILWEQMEPRLLRLFQNPRNTGRMSSNEDDVRNMLVALMEKLREKDSKRLRDFLEKHEGELERFEGWLVVVAKRVAIDYMRGHHDYVDRRREINASSAGKWLIPVELPSDSQLVGNRPQVTSRGSALTLLRYAYDTLPKEQMTALELWILGRPYDEIATELAMSSAADASRAVKAGLERLRRRFREA